MAKLGGRKIATGVAASEAELPALEEDVQDVQGQLQNLLRGHLSVQVQGTPV